MKDGTTRMAYKAEHAVDLDTDIVVAATVHPGNAPDTQTIIDTAIDAAVNAEQAGVENDLQGERPPRPSPRGGRGGLGERVSGAAGRRPTAASCGAWRAWPT
jgi:hypothetical protein